MSELNSAFEKVVVVGASGFGREALDVLVAMNTENPRLDILGVVDDSPSEVNLQRLKSRGIAYLGTVDELIHSNQTNVSFVLGIGNPLIRSSIAEKFQSAGWGAYTAVHPRAVIGTDVEFGNGTVVCAGVTVSTNVRLGRHVHLNPNSTIGHDSILEDYVSINPAAVISGEVLVQKQALVGASATVLQGLTVGPSALVGACACVTKDVKPGQIVKGIPAK